MSLEKIPRQPRVPSDIEYPPTKESRNRAVTIRMQEKVDKLQQIITQRVEAEQTGDGMTAEMLIEEARLVKEIDNIRKEIDSSPDTDEQTDPFKDPFA